MVGVNFLMKEGKVVLARPGNLRTAEASLICFTTTRGVVEAAWTAWWTTAGRTVELKYLGVVSPFHLGRLKVL